MPFIRQTRDKRGYEYTFVMHAYRPTQGPGHTRVLYFSRTPVGLKIGRRPLDPEVTEALEHTHPDLSFDWTSVLREPEAGRHDPRDRDRDRDRGRDRSQRQQAPAQPQTRREPPRQPPVFRAAPPQSPGPAPVPSAPDDTPLGMALGAATAARLRARYQELVQRIGRRARTPEERDRLLARAQRLNPDEWTGDDAMRANAAGADAEWGRIAGELPARRRGRRGGRQRPGSLEPGASPSAIMTASGNDADDNQDEPVEGGPAGPAGAPVDRGAGGGSEGPVGGGSGDFPIDR